jgi:flagellar hook-length control protein FliK
MINQIQAVAFDMSLKSGEIVDVSIKDGSRFSLKGEGYADPNNRSVFFPILQNGIAHLCVKTQNSQKYEKLQTIAESHVDPMAGKGKAEQTGSKQNSNHSTQSATTKNTSQSADINDPVPNLENSELGPVFQPDFMSRSMFAEEDARNFIETTIDSTKEMAETIDAYAKLKTPMSDALHESSPNSDAVLEQLVTSPHGFSSEEMDRAVHDLLHADISDSSCDLSLTGKRGGNGPNNSPAVSDMATNSNINGNEGLIKPNVPEGFAGVVVKNENVGYLPVNGAEELLAQKVQVNVVNSNGRKNHDVQEKISGQGTGAAEPVVTDEIISGIAVKKAEIATNPQYQRGISENANFSIYSRKVVVAEEAVSSGQSGIRINDFTSFSKEAVPSDHGFSPAEMDSAARDLSAVMKNAVMESNITDNSKAAVDDFAILKNKEGKEIIVNSSRLHSEADGKFRMTGSDVIHSYNNLSLSSGAADSVSSEDMLRVNQLISHLPEGALKAPGRVRISLYPESLGNVDIDIIVSGSKVRVVLTADRADVMQALQGQQEQLKNSFQSQNLQLSSLDFQMRENSAAMDDGARGGNLWQHENQGGSRNENNGGEHIASIETLTPAMKRPLQMHLNERVISLFI